MFVAIVTLASALVIKDRMVTVRSSDDIYTWRFREQILGISPEWHESQENPPLSVRQAISVSDKVVERLDAVSQPWRIGNWELVSLYISPLDNRGFTDSRSHWCYVAQFHGYRIDKATSGPPIQISCVVLMNGSVFIGEGGWLDDRLEAAVRASFGNEDGDN